MGDMGIDVEGVKKDLGRVLQQYPVRFVVLFGSAASGIVKDRSDIDIAVFLDDGKLLSSSEIYSDLLDILCRAFGVFEDRIDLTDLKKANILLRYEVTSGGVLLYGGADAYEQFRLFAVRDYVDAEALRDLEDVLLRKRQDELARVL
jgi:uncharacterized protein